jgi:serine/threonine protein kinase/tetratricopeptide (TPR) repeat protein
VAAVSSPLADALRDRYVIDRELGRGGMATVWLARDLKHDRPVALKVLRPELSAILGGERFLREIRLTAALQHPHILPLLDSGEAAGLLYYVMPFVEGKSLRHRLERDGQIPLENALQLSRGVAAALEYAHGQGVIHRDIKPENILLYQGEPMVADFGIALAAASAGRERLTESGLSLGTPAYMSPEQASAEPRLDGRSDQYSLACVVYEMLTGEPPYTGPTAQAIIAKHLSASIPSVRTVRPDIRENLDDAIQRALAKSPAGRFASVSEMAAALVLPPTAGGRHTRRITAGVAGVVAVTAVLWGLLPRDRSSRSTAERQSVAVIPFANLSPDPQMEYFSDGITEDITTHLGRIGDLKVIANTSASQFKGRRDAPGIIGDALHVTTLLQGSVRREGSRVRVVARLVDVLTGEQIWTEEYDREVQDVFAIQSDIAERIASSLRVTLPSDQRASPVRPPTGNAEAYNLYLLGRHYFEQGTITGRRRAIENFERAIGLDSGFALAYVGLADTKMFLARFGQARPREVIPAARDAALRAISLDSNLAEAHASFALVSALAWNWGLAEAEFRRAIDLNPNSTYVRMWYSAFVLSPQQRHDEAIAELRKALDLDPVSLQVRYQLGMANYFAGRLDSAIAAFRATLDLDRNYSPARAGLGFAYAAAGRYDKAIEETQRAVADSAVTSEAVLGYIFALAGRQAQARTILRRLQERARREYVPPADFKLLYIGLGQMDSAFYWLGKSYEEREPLLLWDAAGRDNPMGRDPRFSTLLTKMGLGGTSASRDSPRE